MKTRSFKANTGYHISTKIFLFGWFNVAASNGRMTEELWIGSGRSLFEILFRNCYGETEENRDTRQ